MDTVSNLSFFSYGMVGITAIALAIITLLEEPEIEEPQTIGETISRAFSPQPPIQTHTFGGIKNIRKNKTHKKRLNKVSQ